MHQLNRAQCRAPACLRKYRYGRDRWEDISNDDRQEIRTALEEMQGRRCAYCECCLDKHGQHIEHFRQRNDPNAYAQGTFDWNNLFWSCERGDSCGKHKDGCGSYNHQELIKPDVEDPEQFFLFVFDGSITLRSGLTAAQQCRAKETLRIFNLDTNGGPLRRMREIAVSGYLAALKELQELTEIFSPQDIAAYIASEFAYTQELPFCTAIKHALTPQGIT
jgi:uncharacterized protein (TIGR02646 family)